MDINKCIGESKFQIVDIAKTNDSVNQVLRIDQWIKLPYGTSWKDHHKVCKEAIQKMRMQLDEAEAYLEGYFTGVGCRDGNRN